MHPRPPARYLIVNADDFGMSSGVNAGTIAAYQYGIVTSVSLLVQGEAAAEAARFLRANPNLSVGLHLDLGEWRWANGDWEPVHEMVTLGDVDAVREECHRQIEIYRELLGQNPTHLDSHQNVHRDEPVRGVARELAAEMGVPLRHFAPSVSYCGRFSGQTNKGLAWPEGISVASLQELLAELPPGISELGCHPGWDEELPSTYRRERRMEVDTLCDPAVRAELDVQRIELISFVAAAAYLELATFA